MPKLEYETIETFPSSKGDKVYVVKRRLDTGALSCSCPSWVFNQKGNRTCYHTLAVELKRTRPVVKESYKQATQALTSTRELPRKLNLEGGS